MSPTQTLGKYKILRRIGVGGMAEVFEATLEGTAGFSKRVALKVLLPACRRDPMIVSMFIDEATLVAKLDHPNIVNVYDFGQVDESHYMAMEYVDGWDLGHLIQTSQRRGQPFSAGSAALIVRELCRALQYVHQAEQQVIHRDVTPHNVFVTRRGQVKLGDFGIAKSAARQARTEDGQIKGKLAYLAPEQVTGEPVSPRTDVYAAGLILFELLTGRRLIAADREIDLLQVAQNPPVAELTAARPEATALEPVLRQTLERHPTMRHPSAEALATDLDQFLNRQSPPFDAESLARDVRQLEGDAEPRPVVAARSTVPVANGRPEPASTVPKPQTKVLQQQRSDGPPTGRMVVYAGLALAVGTLVVLGIWRLSSRSSLHLAQDAGAVVAHAPPVDATSPVSPDVSVADSRRDTRSRPNVVRRPRRPTVRTPSPDAAAPVPIREPDASVEKALKPLRAELDRLRRLARSRGLWPGDDPELDRRVRSVQAAVDTKQRDAATRGLRELRQRVDAFRIDRTFVKAKMARLDRAIAAAKLPPAEQRRMTATSQRILFLIMEERFVEASRLMSQTRARLSSR